MNVSLISTWMKILGEGNGKIIPYHRQENEINMPSGTKVDSQDTLLFSIFFLKKAVMPVASCFFMSPVNRCIFSSANKHLSNQVATYGQSYQIF